MQRQKNWKIFKEHVVTCSKILSSYLLSLLEETHKKPKSVKACRVSKGYPRDWRLDHYRYTDVLGPDCSLPPSQNRHH
jgi:hypothetical protein